MLNRINIDTFKRNDWELYAKEFADYNIYQTWAYQEVRADMARQRISRILIRDKQGDVQTMCQIRIKHIKPMRLNIGYVQFGPLVMGEDRTLKCSVQALKVLHRAYVGTKVSLLRIVPNVCDDEIGKQFSEILISSGFQHNSLITPYRTMMLQVDDSEEGIRERLHKSFRRDLKKAEKAGIEIREGNDERFCEILEKLYLTSLKRKGFKGLDPKEFIRPQFNLSASEKMNIIVAYYDGEPVAVLLVSNLGDTSVVLLAASNEQGLSCGASYLVWYRGAISALDKSMKWYDLGGVDPINNPNIFQFKSRMGGVERFHLGAYEAYSNPTVKHILSMAEKFYRKIKK